MLPYNIATSLSIRKEFLEVFAMIFLTKKKLEKVKCPNIYIYINDVKIWFLHPRRDIIFFSRTETWKLANTYFESLNL